MRNCRVCRGIIALPSYDAPAPALTSIMTLLDMPTRVFVCEGCGHAQCDDIPDIRAFYDTTYRISLGSSEYDQIFAVKPDGSILYRTDHQARLTAELLNLPPGASVLDYGAAKATTLRKLHANRPDILPHVFDVSADYTAAWQDWVPRGQQACYDVPASWSGRFDAVTSHFVIEHVADPVGFIANIRGLLKPDGKLLLSMPDVDANPGDMTVADHLNHFSEASLQRALTLGGFTLTTLDRSSFPGAFFVVATAGNEDRAADPALVAGAVSRAHAICDFWEGAASHLTQQTRSLQGRKAAIYGAGFYGTWIFSRVGGALAFEAFLDRNPHLVGDTHFGLPVLAPENIPEDLDVLFIGLNPLKARDAIGAQPWLQRSGLDHVWL